MFGTVHCLHDSLSATWTSVCLQQTAEARQCLHVHLPLQHGGQYHQTEGIGVCVCVCVWKSSHCGKECVHYVLCQWNIVIWWEVVSVTNCIDIKLPCAYRSKHVFNTFATSFSFREFLVRSLYKHKVFKLQSYCHIKSSLGLIVETNYIQLCISKITTCDFTLE